MSRTSTPPSEKRVEEMSESEKDDLLERLAEEYEDDEVLSGVFEMAAQVSSSEDKRS